jgi:hypothetical protein
MLGNFNVLPRPFSAVKETGLDAIVDREWFESLGNIGDGELIYDQFKESEADSWRPEAFFSLFSLLSAPAHGATGGRI